MNDLEELKIKNSKIYSLGKKTYDLKDIDGRFLGITKFSKKIIKDLKKNFISKILRKNKNIDFTNFLMELISKNFKIKAISGKFEWHEFDNPRDFKIFKKNKKYLNLGNKIIFFGQVTCGLCKIFYHYLNKWKSIFIYNSFNLNVIKILLNIFFK